MKTLKTIFSILLLSFVFNSSYAQIEEEVDFSTFGLILHGTLTYPDSIHKFPLVILVHGSGPNERDQAITLTGGNSLCLYPDIYNWTIRNFKDLSDQLVARNYAVLRYDKRTNTYPNLNPATVTVNHFVDDINSAVETLRVHERVDSNCVALLGHSQGSALIPLAAINNQNVTHLISLAGPVTPIDTIYTEQIRELYYRCVPDSLAGDSVANSYYAVFDSIRNDLYPSNKAFQGAFPLFWKSWLDRTDSVLSNYAKAGLPSLFLQGTNDFNVPFQELSRFEDGLSNPENDYILFDSVNHFGTYYGETRVDTAITFSIANWLGKAPTLAVGDQWGFESIQVFMDRNAIRIRSQKQMLRVELYDIQGRRLYSQEIEGHTSSISTNALLKSTQMVFCKVYLAHGQVVRTFRLALIHS